MAFRTAKILSERRIGYASRMVVDEEGKNNQVTAWPLLQSSVRHAKKPVWGTLSVHYRPLFDRGNTHAFRHLIDLGASDTAFEPNREIGHGL